MGSLLDPTAVPIPATPAVGPRYDYQAAIPVSAAQSIRTLAAKTPAARSAVMNTDNYAGNYATSARGGPTPAAASRPLSIYDRGLGYTPAAGSVAVPGSVRTINASLAGKTPGMRRAQLNNENFAGAYSRGGPAPDERTPRIREEMELPPENNAASYALGRPQSTARSRVSYGGSPQTSSGSVIVPLPNSHAPTPSRLYNTVEDVEDSGHLF